MNISKEAMRKEFEDCWDEGLVVGWDNARHGHSKRPNRNSYITTRLAALGDGDEVTESPWKDMDGNVLVDDGQEGKGSRTVKVQKHNMNYGKN